MSKAYEGLTLRITGDLSDLNNQLKKLNAPLRSTERELKAIDKALKFNPGNAELVAQKQQVLAKRTDELKDKLNILKDAKEKADEQFKNGEISEEEYRKLNREIETTTDKLNKAEQAEREFQSEINRANSAIGKQADKIGALGDKTYAAGQKIDGLGNKLMPISAGAIAGAAAIGKAAIDYETAFAGVRKTVDATEEEYASLSKGILNLSKEVPAAATEIAGVAEAAGQLGIHNDQIINFSKSMIDLGEATNMTSEEAATMLARFANIMSMDQSNFDRLGSTIVALGNNFATTEAEITEMGLRLAGAGKQIGMSEADIMGIAAALSSVGIESQAGGTAFSKVMKQMAVATETGNKQLKDFADVAGMSTKQFADAFKKDPVTAIQAFLEGLGSMDEKGTSAIKTLEDMGLTEIRLSDALLRTSNSTEIFGDAIKMANGAWEENTALTKEADERYKTTASQLKMLWNEVKIIAIELGDAFLPALKDVIGGAKDAVKTFQNMDESTKKMVGKVILFTAAAAPALKVTGALVKGVGSLGRGFRAFTNTKAVKTIIDYTAATKSASAATSTFTAAQATQAAGQKSASALFGANATKITQMGAATTTTATSTGKMTTAIGGTITKIAAFGPHIAAGAIAVGVLAGAVYGIKQAIDEANYSFISLEDREKQTAATTEEVNKALTKTAENQLKAFDDAKKAFSEDLQITYTGGEIISSDISSKLIQQVKDMMGSVRETIETESKGAQESFSKMFSFDGTVSGDELGILDSITEIGADRIAKTQKIESKINEIISTAREENRTLTQDDMKAIQILQNEALQMQLESLTKSEEAQLALAENLKAQQDSITSKNHEELLDKITTVNTDARKELDAAYAEATGRAAAMFGKDTPEYDKAITELNESYAKRTRSIETNTREELTVIRDALEKEKAMLQEKQDAANKSGQYGLAESYRKQKEEVGTALKQIENTIDDSLEHQQSVNKTHGKKMSTSLGKGLGAGRDVVDREGKAVAKAATKGLESEDGKSNTLGSNYGSGFVSGIGSWIKKAWTKGWELAKSALGGTKKAQDSDSPAKETIKLAGDYVDGYTITIAAGAGKASASGALLGMSSLSGLSGSLKGVSGIATSFMSTYSSKLKSEINKLQAELELMEAQAEAKKKAKEKADYEASKKTAADNKKKDIKDNKADYQKDLKALDKQYADKKKKNGKLTAKEKADYEKKKKALKNKYDKANKADIKKYNNEITKIEADWREKQAEAEAAARKEKLQAQLDTYNDALSQLESFMEKIDSLAEKWGGQELILNVGGFDTLNNFEDDIYTLEKLWTELEKLQKREMPNELYLKMANMDEATAIKWAEALNAMTDAEYQKYIENWKKKESLSKELATGYYSVTDEYKEMAEAVVKAFADTITLNSPLASEAVAKMMKDAIAAAHKALDMHSPPKTFEKMGLLTPIAYAQGVDKNSDKADDAISKMFDFSAYTHDFEVRAKEYEKASMSRSMQQATTLGNALAQTINIEGKEAHFHIHLGSKEIKEFAVQLYDPLKEEAKRRGDQ